MIDISIVTYNSEKHLDTLFSSLLNQEMNLKEISLSFFDNASQDNTTTHIDSFQCLHQKQFKQITLQCIQTNLGFGQGHNQTLLKGQSPYLFLLNPDTELFPNTLSLLLKAAQNSQNDVAAWEARQLPYEHPKLYSPITLETEWVSGAAVLIKRDAFEKVGGFDPKFFLYCEDVDLSYRLQNAKYKLHYCPQASVLHHTYQKPDELKPQQYLYTTLGNLYLRTRFGNNRQIACGILFYFAQMLKKQKFEKQRRQMAKNFFTYLRHFPYFLKGKRPKICPSFNKLDYGVKRKGAFYPSIHHSQLSSCPTISVLIRSTGNHLCLTEALQSVRHQTYPNIEVVLVEDGPTTLKKTVEAFHDLNINYFALGKREGRSNAGNQAMQLASGEYFLFLDEDDLLYADHLEQLMGALQQEKSKITYSLSFEVPTAYDVAGKITKEKTYCSKYTQPFSFFTLLQKNYIPILNVLFHRSLFEQAGGFRDDLEYNEDWDLWLRYSLSFRPFTFVKKTTALYRVPYSKKKGRTRKNILEKQWQSLQREYAEKKVEVTIAELNAIYPEGSRLRHLIRTLCKKIRNRIKLTM